MPTNFLGRENSSRVTNQTPCFAFFFVDDTHVVVWLFPFCFSPVINFTARTQHLRLLFSAVVVPIFSAQCRTTLTPAHPPSSRYCFRCCCCCRCCHPDGAVHARVHEPEHELGTRGGRVRAVGSEEHFSIPHRDRCKKALENSGVVGVELKWIGVDWNYEMS